MKSPVPFSATPYPEAFEKLMEFLRTLPGVGRRSAERMALQLFAWDPEKLASFGEALSHLRDRIGICPLCGGMSSGPGQICAICADEKRDHAFVCVVEDYSRLRTIESSGVFKGVYHVLGGRLSPLEGKMADSLFTDPLVERASSGEIREVILALSPDVEGQATAVYVADLLKNTGAAVSRPAQGLPAGADIGFADPATVAAAVNGRTKF